MSNTFIEKILLRNLSDEKLTEIMMGMKFHYNYTNKEMEEIENKIKQIKPDYVMPWNIITWIPGEGYVIKKYEKIARKREILKYNIDNFKEEDEEKEELKTTYFIIFGVMVLLYVFAKKINADYEAIDLEYEKYNNSNIMYMNNDYSIQDVYVIYNVNKVWFCTRKLEKITENSSNYGYMNRRRGQTDEYYYREEIYGYYDIITGEKICQDHEDGFYSEALIDVYSKEESKNHNYNVDLDNLQDEVTIDELLSEEGTIKPKIKKYN